MNSWADEIENSEIENFEIAKTEIKKFNENNDNTWWPPRIVSEYTFDPTINYFIEYNFHEYDDLGRNITLQEKRQSLIPWTIVKHKINKFK
jgi:hypothetical protein